MADQNLKQIADAAHAVETAAETLSTLLARSGADEASKFFEQCAKGAHQVVQEVPAAPGNDGGQTDGQADTAVDAASGAGDQGAAADAAPQGGGTPQGASTGDYAQGAREVQAQVRKRKG